MKMQPGSSSSDVKAYKGVRDVGRVVEIKNWLGRGRHFYKTVVLSPQEAAVAHDLARMHVVSAVDVKFLNITRLGFEIQMEGSVMPARGDRPLTNIGKELYAKFVKDNPLSMQTDNTTMQNEIIAQAPKAFEYLKRKIKRIHDSQAGRHRREEYEFLPKLEEGDPLEISIEENISQQNVTKDAEIAALKKACEGKDAENAALKKACEGKDAENAALRKACEEKIAENAALRKACEEKDAEITAKDVGMNKLKQVLYEVDEQAKVLTPFKSGFAMREKYLHNDSNSASVDGMGFVDGARIKSNHPSVSFAVQDANPAPGDWMNYLELSDDSMDYLE